MEACRGAEVELHSFLTSALEWLTFTPRPLCPREKIPVPLNRRVGEWATEPVWKFTRREKSLVPNGIRIPNRPAGSVVSIPIILLLPLNNICNVNNVVIIKPNIIRVLYVGVVWAWCLINSLKTKIDVLCIQELQFISNRTQPMSHGIP